MVSQVQEPSAAQLWRGGRFSAAFAFDVATVYSRTWVATFAAVAVTSTLAARVIYSVAVVQLARRGLFTRNMVFAGDEAHIERLLGRIGPVLPEVVSVVGLFTTEPSAPSIRGEAVRGNGLVPGSSPGGPTIAFG